FGGLDFIAMNFAPRTFWTTGLRSLDISYSRLMDDLARARIPMVQVKESAPVASIGGVAIVSLNGSEAARTQNNSSMVLRFSFGDASILFTGDIESVGEHAMLASGGDLHARILKVPHHGSASSSTAAFIAAVHPEAVVISDGYLNNFHFPAASVVQRYVDAGALLTRTDLDGAVMVDATPARMTVRTFRNPRAVPIRLAPVTSSAVR
ncbi:MAG TPA: MBL fold metallo-hydrolase, partial [Candidatus Acidoferrum sp.]|nr:MBL fold metallo-hydrolase [Candidatus Acidoferrum sp.]